MTGCAHLRPSPAERRPIEASRAQNSRYRARTRPSEARDRPWTGARPNTGPLTTPPNIPRPGSPLALPGKVPTPPRLARSQGSRGSGGLDDTLGNAMLEVSLSGFGKARVWSRECPVDPVKPYNGIALEVSIPRGGMCAYGLLGASAGLHHSGPGCEVVAPASGRRWHGSLVERIDEVRVGLPAELVAPVQRAGAAEAEGFACA